ncbi:glycoside hydrolase family 9 protein [Saccharospirillum mangrovi]|uniref:glycoside hydrolase family 9 protein n=1 Tax=Saccharospirillum mangrovi TaxID=2161747 RepID=UPI000D3BE40F|nr:glycoside hydrolase family 9 protein [Saccharospirillum mangrovi]
MTLQSKHSNTGRLLTPHSFQPASATTPVQDAQTKGLTAEALRQHRDLAWGAFHWFNSAAYPNAHQQDRQAPVYGCDDRRDLTGGWYDGPDYGHYAISTAWSIALPLLTWMIRPQALPERIQPMHSYSLHRPAVLDLVEPSLRFLLAMQRGDGAVHHKLCSEHPAGLSEAPADDQRQRWLMPISTAATANAAAVLHLAGAAFAHSGIADDWQLARQCRLAAQRASEFLALHPESITAPTSDDARFGQAYADADERDNRLWADVARSWSDPSELADRHFARLWELAGSDRLGDAQPGWQQLNFLALFNFLAMPHQDRVLKDALLTRMEKTFHAERDRQLQQPFARLQASRDDNSSKDNHSKDNHSEENNGTLATLGTQLLWLHQLTGRRTWYDAAFDLSGWFFGHNPHGKTWTTGNADGQVQQPQFAPLISGALQAAPGLLAAGVQSAQAEYRDEPQASANAVRLDAQSPWACYLSLLVAGPR